MYLNREQALLAQILFSQLLNSGHMRIEARTTSFHDTRFSSIEGLNCYVIKTSTPWVQKALAQFFGDGDLFMDIAGLSADIVLLKKQITSRDTVQLEDFWPLKTALTEENLVILQPVLLEAAQSALSKHLSASQKSSSAPVNGFILLMLVKAIVRPSLLSLVDVSNAVNQHGSKASIGIVSPKEDLLVEVLKIFFQDLIKSGLVKTVIYDSGQVSVFFAYPELASAFASYFKIDEENRVVGTVKACKQVRDTPVCFSVKELSVSFLLNFFSHVLGDKALQQRLFHLLRPALADSLKMTRSPLDNGGIALIEEAKSMPELIDQYQVARIPLRDRRQQFSTLFDELNRHSRKLGDQFRPTEIPKNSQ